MRTSNPALNDNSFSGYGRVLARGEAHDRAGDREQDRFSAAARAPGRGLDLAHVLHRANSRSLPVWVLGGALGGFVVALITIFKRQWSR